MPKTKKDSAFAGATAATVGYESQLGQMADAPRGGMEAANQRHVCLAGGA